jgi:hypothetical protein
VPAAPAGFRSRATLSDPIAASDTATLATTRAPAVPRRVGPSPTATATPKERAAGAARRGETTLVDAERPAAPGSGGTSVAAPAREGARPTGASRRGAPRGGRAIAPPGTTTDVPSGVMTAATVRATTTDLVARGTSRDDATTAGAPAEAASPATRVGGRVRARQARPVVTTVPAAAEAASVRRRRARRATGPVRVAGRVLGLLRNVLAAPNVGMAADATSGGASGDPETAPRAREAVTGGGTTPRVLADRPSVVRAGLPAGTVGLRMRHGLGGTPARRSPRTSPAPNSTPWRGASSRRYRRISRPRSPVTS